MRELMKHATSDELRLLMNTFMDTDSTTSDQVDMLFAVVDELTERGGLPKITEYETHADLENIKAIIREQEIIPQTDEETEPIWMDDLRADMLQDRQRRKVRRKSYVRTTLTAASLIIILFLSNVVALASGHDFFGAIAKWTKDAVYFVFGTDSADEPIRQMTKEYDGLRMVLEENGIHVDLPTFIPDGFMFDSIEPDEPDESSNIVAWFFNGDEYFSIRIIRVSAKVDVRFNESDGEEYAEVYPEKNGKYLVTTNESRIKAIWYQGIYEIKLQGSISYEQLTQILDSI